MCTAEDVWCGEQKTTMLTGGELVRSSCEPLHQVASSVSLCGAQHFLGGVQGAASQVVSFCFTCFCLVTLPLLSHIILHGEGR